MKKQDLIPVVLLVFLLITWGDIDRKIIKPFIYGIEPGSEQVAEPAAAGSDPAGSNNPDKPAALTSTETVAAEVLSSEPANVPSPVEEGVPEMFEYLENDSLKLKVSSQGSIVSATLKKFQKSLEEPEKPLVLDFTTHPALKMLGLPKLSILGGIGVNNNVATLLFQGEKGFSLTRKFALSDDYRIEVKDVYTNESGALIRLPEHQIQLGNMLMLEGVYSAGMATVGVDVYLQSSDNALNLAGRNLKEAKKSNGNVYSEDVLSPVDWMAVKNKFFTNLLFVQSGDMEAPKGYSHTTTYFPEKKTVSNASADILLKEILLEPKQSQTRNMDFYVGPKEYKALKQLANDEHEIMEFGYKFLRGLWKLLCPILLTIIIFFHNIVGNYGVAIILLTVVVRLAFWSLTQKSTDSMKKMQKLAPDIKVLKEKHKDNPQAQQQAMMALYKEHKVNPMSGCLPMLIQMPIFLALFFMLRSAVELRFADFLWVKDLSEAENLFKGLLPFGVNFLPFAMSGTMFLQMRMNPQGGDPMQAKIMQMMPIMMMVFLYNMPSGLLLYWTTSNLISMAQMKYTKHRDAKSEAAEAGKVEVLPPKIKNVKPKKKKK